MDMTNQTTRKKRQDPGGCRRHTRREPEERKDEAFNRIRDQNPSFPMPAFDRLRESMPGWKQLHEEYDKAKDDK